MHTELLGVNESRWQEHLQTLRHDVYHVPEYISFATRHETPGEPVAIVATEGDRAMLVPLIVRPIDVEGLRLPGARDAITPHGYSGPIGGQGDLDFLARATAAIRDQLAAQNIVSVFIRMHPLLSPAPPRPLIGTIVDHGESVSIDLSISDDAHWHQTRENHRRGINKAQRAGYRARVDASLERLNDFVRIYQESMERIGAAAYWRLGQAYFTDLFESLGPRLHLLVVEWDGDLAAGCLMTETCGIVEYHLAGTATAHVSASPTKLLIHFARSWAKERGDSVLHLAGSSRPRDSLSYFKVGFSPLRHAVSSWRMVTDPPSYDALTGEWSRLAGVPSDGPDGFFPAYRKALPQTG